jgi:hypothetical protein
MAWKIVAVGLGVSTLILAVMTIRGHRRMAGGPPAAGEVRPDTRGATALAAQQITFGPRAVAEAAKKTTLGETRSQNRDEQKKLRAA